jgi:Fic family protein
MLDQWLSKIDDLKAELDSYRPLPPDALEQLRRFYRVGLTYSSNALEGNTLTESETQMVLETGITVAGKPLAHHLEAVGHAEALDTMLKQVTTSKLPTQAAIVEWHRVLMQGLLKVDAGVYRTIPVILTGSTFEPPPANAISTLMETLFNQQLPQWRKQNHPVVLAALGHYQLVNIHPFLDGNGRLSRLFMNALLLQAGYPAVIIPPVMRNEYIQALRTCQEVSVLPETSSAFVTFIAEMTYEGLKDYVRLLRRLQQ